MGEFFSLWSEARLKEAADGRQAGRINHKGHEGAQGAFSEIPNVRFLQVRDLYDIESPQSPHLKSGC
jgi:hypothetical protein